MIQFSHICRLSIKTERDPMKTQNENRAEGWDVIHRSRHMRLIGMLALLVIITISAILYTSITLFSRATREYRTDSLTGAAQLAVGIIDGDIPCLWVAPV